MGALVNFIQKKNLKEGIVNGAMARVISIKCNNKNVVIAINVQLYDTCTTMVLRKNALKYRYSYNAYYYKTSFPIIITYVMTGHKAQNATIASKIYYTFEV